jgi:HK97 family phage major capsid protein
VISRLRYVFSIVEEYNFLQGNGTNRPLGVFTASAHGINTDRDVTSSGAAGAMTADDIIETIFTLKAQYRRNARFILGRDTLREIRQLKDGQGNYLMVPGLTGGQPDRISGYPFSESEYCPTFAATAYVLVFGDFSYYWICDALNIQVQVLNELYARTNQVGIIMRKESDGMPVLAEAFCRLQLN